MIEQQLGIIKLKIEPNYLPKESRYLKIPRNKSWFSAVIFDFNRWNFVSREMWGAAKLKLFYLVSLTQIRSQYLVPRKLSRILRNFPLLKLLSLCTFFKLRHSITHGNHRTVVTTKQSCQSSFSGENCVLSSRLLFITYCYFFNNFDLFDGLEEVGGTVA